MIPSHITLQNFLSYGSVPQTVSFEGYNLMCLSGKNGHGKSALLDGITWALWGQARKTVGTGKPDEGLLRLGAKQMVVIFECVVNNQTYRIRREYSRAQGKPQTNLDVAVYDAASNEYRSLTEKTIRGTQAVIEQLIGLDYETYVNSAFLRQGHANEFSQKSPKERKKILTTILGVDKYDALQSFALEKGREAVQQIRMLQELNAQDEELLQGEVVLQQSYATTKEALAQSEQRIVAVQKDFVAAQRALEQYRVAYQNFVVHMQECEKKAASLRERATIWQHDAQSWRTSYHHFLQQPSSDRLQVQVQSLKTQEADLRVVQKKHDVFSQSLMAIEKKLFERQRVLEAEHTTQRELLSQQLHQAKAACDIVRNQKTSYVEQSLVFEKEYKALCDKQLVLSEKLEKIREESARYAVVKKQYDKRYEFYTAYAPRARWLYAQYQELRQKQQLSQDENSPSCPLCEQMLSAKRKQFLCDKLTQQLHSVSHKYEQLKKVLTNLKALLTVQQEEVRAYEKIMLAAQSMQAEYEHGMAQIKLHELRAQERSEKLRSIECEIQKKEQELQATLLASTQYEQKIKDNVLHDIVLVALRTEQVAQQQAQAALGYDATLYSQLEAQLREAEQLLSVAEKRTEAQQKLKSQRAILTTQWHHIRHEQKAVQAQQQALVAHSLQEEEVQRLEALFITQEHALQSEQKIKEQLLTDVSALQTKQTYLVERKAACKKREESLKGLEELRSDYTMLATAWGKNGIQALLIEQAIPEIEQEANQLLARLTNNQAQVFIESQRDLKSGGVRETLDIKISDTMGVRPYEMFSGGEAFRIDFALRVAISKLLAHRAGTALQVLIIDEGFGSQDEEGLAQLMQALYAVQDDFKKIIVVSHLTDFKENFPVHFVVHKGAMGSVVSVEQRG